VFDRKRLAADFRALGVEPGDTIMLHASVRAVGEVAGGPDEIHLALKDALTPDGTLMMYASCPRYVDELGRGNLTAAEEVELLDKLPAFDAHTARSARDNGVLVEFLRTYPESRVNEHVVRFVAWGKQASYLFSEHPWDFAFGHGSALERFLKLDGRNQGGCVGDASSVLFSAAGLFDVAGPAMQRVAAGQPPFSDRQT
jgi:aminoglycoside 3-N-acetyltransferase